MISSGATSRFTPPSRRSAPRRVDAEDRVRSIGPTTRVGGARELPPTFCQFRLLRRRVPLAFYAHPYIPSSAVRPGPVPAPPGEARTSQNPRSAPLDRDAALRPSCVFWAIGRGSSPGDDPEKQQGFGNCGQHLRIRSGRHDPSPGKSPTQPGSGEASVPAPGQERLRSRSTWGAFFGRMPVMAVGSPVLQSPASGIRPSTCGVRSTTRSGTGIAAERLNSGVYPAGARPARRPLTPGALFRVP